MSFVHVSMAPHLPRNKASGIAHGVLDRHATFTSEVAFAFQFANKVDCFSTLNLLKVVVAQKSLISENTGFEVP